MIGKDLKANDLLPGDILQAGRIEKKLSEHDIDMLKRFPKGEMVSTMLIRQCRLDNVVRNGKVIFDRHTSPCEHIYGFIDFNALPPAATMAITITTEEESTNPYVRTKDFLSYGNGGLKCNYCPLCGEKLKD